MPTVAASHPILDIPTVFAVTVFISAMAGLLLIFSWLQNRNTPALAMWGVGFLLGAVAAAMLASVGFTANNRTVCVANALICVAYGLAWGGARSFEGRRIHVALMAAGAVIWVAAFQLEMFASSVAACMKLVALISGTYTLLCARELWHGRDPELLSRWPTLLLALLHAGFLFARAPLADMLSASMANHQPHGAAVTLVAFEALFVTFCMPFLRVAMAKERAELAQRKAALTDSLTGVANRRAFFELGAPLLEAAAVERRCTALLLFDLDRFKEINDTVGHQAGDRVLQAFANLIAGAVRPGDLFARLGGEEFACLLADASMAQALHTAERLRRKVEAIRMPELPAAQTVSIGVAMAGETSRTLPELLACADRALYRAKAEGRNRIASARPVLIEAKSGEKSGDAARRPVLAPAPIAG